MTVYNPFYSNEIAATTMGNKEISSSLIHHIEIIIMPHIQ